MVSMQKIPGASCVLGSSSCSPADEGKTMERRANSPKAPECRAPSAPAAACQSPGISLPVSKPAPQRADPCPSACSRGKAGCSPLECFLARGMRAWEGQVCRALFPLLAGTSSTQRMESGIGNAGTCLWPGSVPVPVAHSASGDPGTCQEPGWELER